MRDKYLLTMISIFFLIILSISCKEELIVESKKKDAKTINSVLAKENINLSMVSDSLSKKDKIAKLKKEHEKPYMAIETPETLLASYLKTRADKKSLSKTSNNLGSYSVQSTQSCYTIEIDVWILNRYISKTNFITAIWPKEDWMTNNQYISQLRNYSGFSHFATYHDWIPIAENNGYSLNNIIALVDGHFPQVVKESYNQSGTRGPCGFYYADEPDHIPSSFFNGLGQQIIPYSAVDSVNRLVNYIKGKYPAQNPPVIIGETTVSSTTKFDEIVDFVNCTWYGYDQWPLTNDQRDRWTDFNNSFGSKFNHLWISGEKDRGEMDQLIGRAQNMYKNSIWLYAAEMGMSNQSYWDAIEEFTYYAFMHGYINREEKKYIYVYSYVGNGDPCYDNQVTSWELADIIDTGETRLLAH
ncbi:MAG: hypothetical protein M1495_19465 [Bacteroidetes bacterium]|nr:hypothetical protein [Bacteroidota bacterium]